MSKDDLNTLQELLLRGVTQKACTLGVIIDVTNPYYDDVNNQFMAKMKVIDQSLNQHTLSKNYTQDYCTVMFFGPTADSLPHPHAIGDILYMRRFAFGRYNDQFQGKYYQAPYCSWYLLPGSVKNQHNFNVYQTSSSSSQLNDIKHSSLIYPLFKIREFAQEYLEKTSVVECHPQGSHPKDSDMIAQVIRVSEDSSYYLRLQGGQEVYLPEHVSRAKQGNICKLRSVVRFEDVKGEQLVITNSYTSLTPLPEWSCNAVNFNTNGNKIRDQYTPLHHLLHSPLVQVADRRYRISCEIGSISAMDFHSAVKHYDQDDSKVYDVARKGTEPVYKMTLMVTDDSLDSVNFHEVFIFSFDGECSDFVPRVNLGQSMYSSNVEEKELYVSRCNELLNAERVEMTVEVLSDGKGNRALRAISIK